MLNLSDLIVIAIILIGAWLGYKKGFLRMAFDVGSYIISWFVAVWGYKYISRIIMQSPIIKDALYDFVSQKVVVKNSVSPLVPELFKNAINETTQSLNKTLQDAAVMVLVNFIAMIVTFILAKIVIMGIKNTLGFLRKAPLIGTIDGLVGFVAGAGVALIIIYIALSIIYFFPNAEIFKVVQKNIKDSMFVDYLYENNIIIMMMRQYLKMKI